MKCSECIWFKNGICYNCDGYDKPLYGVAVSTKEALISTHCSEFAPIDKAQQAKSDTGKAQLSLVPSRVIYAIARVREYGTKKYGNKDNWKNVPKRRYRDALYRHLLSYLDDPDGRDEESGLPHLWHIACNVAFLCEQEEIK